MESIYTELSLYGSKNECARTEPVFIPISEVCAGTVSLILKLGIVHFSWVIQFNRCLHNTIPATIFEVRRSCLHLARRTGSFNIYFGTSLTSHKLS